MIIYMILLVFSLFNDDREKMNFNSNEHSLNFPIIHFTSVSYCSIDRPKDSHSTSVSYFTSTI